MELYCTRPGCPRPVNTFADLNDSATLKTVQQKYCTACGMPLMLIGRYLPLRLLGRGGFGAAFLARDRYTPAMRQCVVKQFQPAGNLTPDQLQIAQKLFEREGEVLEDLGNRHPQIPDLLAFFELDVPNRSPGKSDKFFYLVQEFVDGQDMEEELAQKGHFSVSDVIEILVETLKILKFVHENGSIHRDIKPSNIMRDRSGRLYLLDFGAVKQVAAAPAGQGGKASTGIYSMGFAPPEQMRGDMVYPATDLYALAVTCITLLTGKQPNELYDGYSNTWSWRAYAPKVSDRLEAILNRMLLPTPSQRFQSADEVLAALKALVSPAATPVPAPKAAPQAAPSPKPPGQSSAPAASAAQAAPKPVPAPAPAPVVKSRSTRPAFSTLELLGGAAFTGFEGGLVAIALASVLGTASMPAFWVVLLGVVSALVVAQARRWIERVDLLLIAAVSLAVVVLLPPLYQVLVAIHFLPVVSNPIQAIQVVLPFVAIVGLVAVAVTIVFRLVYILLSRFL
jgi:serine/threonine-protein kinase